MSEATAPALTGSLQTVMDNLVEMENRVQPDELRVYMWRPPVPDPPCIWNWIPSAPLRQIDQAKWRDELTIVATLVVRHTDVDIEMAQLVQYADMFRNLVDAELYAPRPLGGHRAHRIGMNSANPVIAGVSYVGFDFPIMVHVDRMILPGA